MSQPHYAELTCYTHYSFLRGASSPSELITRASELGLSGLAITDRNGVYGIPKAYLASKEVNGVQLITGSEVLLESNSLHPLHLLALDRQGYGLLCRILTAAHADKPKGAARLRWDELMQFMERPESRGLYALPALHSSWDWGALHDCLSDRLAIPLSRFYDESDRTRTELALGISKRHRIPIVATGDVHYHHPSRKPLHDVMTVTREGCTLKDAGYKVFSNAERYLKSPAQMHRIFKDLPQAIQQTLAIQERCRFSPSELRYRYPSEWIPAGHSAQTYLEHLVWQEP